MEVNILENSLVLIRSTDECSAISFAEKYFPQSKPISSFDPQADFVSEAKESLTLNQLTIIVAPLDASLNKKFQKLSNKFFVKSVSIILKEVFLCTGSEPDHSNLLQTYEKFNLKARQYKSPHITLVLGTNEELINFSINIIPLSVNKKEETGPFDIISDIHGCYLEFEKLLLNLGYVMDRIEEDDQNWGYKVIPPSGRKLVIAGDLTDRGPEVAEVFKIVMSMVHDGICYCVPGNRDENLLKRLKGKKFKDLAGLDTTLEQLATEPKSLIKAIKKFVKNLPSHLVLDKGRLIVAHGGLPEEMHGRDHKKIRKYALYGSPDPDKTNLKNEWIKDYQGKALVVFGHTPVQQPKPINNTIDIDTGCVYGGKLTALRYPEMEFIQVDAHHPYSEASKPLKTSESLLE